MISRRMPIVLKAISAKPLWSASAISKARASTAPDTHGTARRQAA
jgi:hypothetical protein